MKDRKTLLVDLDNVVYPWAEVMAILVSRSGMSTSYPDDLIKLLKSWEVWEDWQVPKGGFDRVWEAAVESGEMWGVTDHFFARPLPKAVKALWELSDRDWHIHLVTHRLNKFRLHDQAVINTAEWLKQTNIPYRSLTFTEDKHAIQGDVLIDDNPDNLIGHNAQTKILYPAAHNEGFNPGDYGIKGLLRGEGIDPWDEIAEYLGDGLRS